MWPVVLSSTPAAGARRRAATNSSTRQATRLTIVAAATKTDQPLEKKSLMAWPPRVCIAVERQSRRGVEGTAAACAVDPRHQREEQQQADHGDGTAQVVDIHFGSSLLHGGAEHLQVGHQRVELGLALDGRGGAGTSSSL